MVNHDSVISVITVQSLKATVAAAKLLLPSNTHAGMQSRDGGELPRQAMRQIFWNCFSCPLATRLIIGLYGNNLNRCENV